MTVHNHFLEYGVSFETHDAVKLEGGNYTFLPKLPKDSKQKAVSEKEFNALVDLDHTETVTVNEKDPRVMAIRKIEKAGFSSIEEAVASLIK